METVSLDYDQSKVPFEEVPVLIENSPLLSSQPGGYVIQMDNQPDNPDVPLDPSSSRGYLVNPGDQTSVQVQDHVFHEEEVYCCGAKRSPHFRGLTINLALWGTFVLFIIAFATSGGRYNEPFFVVCASLFPIAYVIYLIEAFCSATSRYLWNFDPSENIISYTNRLRGYSVRLSFHCECYHYRTYTTTHRDSKGKTHTQTHRERVTTHRETEPFIYGRCVDDSGDMNESVLVYNTTRVNFSKKVKFGDHMTEAAYQGQKTNFIARNKYRDTHFDFYENEDITDFCSKKMSIVDPKTAGCGMDWNVYFVVTVFLCSSAFYRYWLDRNSVETKYTFIKTIFLH